jgi:Ala-tRNA(Pro) deacylase
MSEQILHAIQRLLGTREIPFSEVHHSAVFTAEEAAAARDRPLEIGAKSIVMKTDDVFRLFVMSGAAAMRSRLIRRHLGVSRTRFASARELVELTGVEPGAVPPFGEPILPLEIYADPGLLAHEQIAFTPGVHTVSILMRADDWVRVAQPALFAFTGSPVR